MSQRTHVIEVINIAYLTGEHSLLPTALLWCCNSDIDVTTGYVRPDGTVQHLMREDLIRCHKALPVLASMSIGILLDIITDKKRDLEKCQYGFSCNNSIRMSIEQVHDVAGGVAKWTNPLCSLDPVLGLPRLVDACKTCRAQLRKLALQAQRAAWTKLPEVFGLSIEGWVTVGEDAEGEVE